MQASVECTSTARQKRQLALYATQRHNRWRHCDCQPVTSSIVASSWHQGFQATPLPVGATRKMFVCPLWKMFTVGYSSWVTKCLLLVNTSDSPHADTVQRRKETYILQIWWIELKYGFYLQNPAYFPRIYLWIFDKYSSTSFWQRLFTEFLRWKVLRRNPSGNWVILIFSGQKPCTRIIFFFTFFKGYRYN